MILTVTLNPAIDKILILRNFVLHKLHRLTDDEECRTVPGGKGVNIAMGLKVLGDDVIATGYAGGYTGHKLCEELRKKDVTTSFNFVEGTTRTNSAILDLSKETLTEINDVGPTIQPDDLQFFVDTYERLLRRVKYVVIAGSLPRGVQEDFYRKLVDIANSYKIKVVLHVSAQYSSLFTNSNPFLINPDMRSHHELLGKPLDGIDQFVNVGRDLLVKNRDTDFVIFTHRLENIVAVTRDKSYIMRPVDLKIVNMLGYGDAFLAGFIHAYKQQLPIVDVLKYASAVGLTNIEYVGKEIHDLSIIEQNLSRIEIEEW